jgi:hypothetical protein
MNQTFTFNETGETPALREIQEMFLRLSLVFVFFPAIVPRAYTLYASFVLNFEL